MKLTNVATALVAFALLITGIPASAYPSALNLIPTAAVLLANTAVFGYEIDGHQQPFDSTGRAQTLYSQVGIDGKLEAGVDLYSFTDGNTATLNAKYLLLEGTDELPAVAVGAFNVNKNGSPDYYLVASKTVAENLRAHLGGRAQGDQTWAQLGADYTVNNKLTLLADAQTGDGRFATLGAFYSITPELGVNLYYGLNNNDKDSNFVGLYVGYTVPFK